MTRTNDDWGAEMIFSDKEIGDLLKQNLRSFAEEVFSLQMEKMPELKQFDSEVFIAKSIRDTEFSILYLSNAISVSSPRLFMNYIQWFLELMESINIPHKYLYGSIIAMGEFFQRKYGVAIDAPLKPYIMGALSLIDHYKTWSNQETVFESPLKPHKDRYVELLLNGRRKEAGELIMDLIEQQYSVEDIYLEIFQESQREIGRLWQHNKITVAEEHYCTAATQLIMGQLYPLIFDTPKNDRVFVGTCVGGELHELGVRMVSDFFELSGWNTYYLGANTPIMSIIETLVKERADVLGVSVTMTFHVDEAQDLIKKVRADKRCTRVKILVGGYPFLVDDTLWEKIGADAYAKNARDAVIIAEKLVSEETVNGES